MARAVVDGRLTQPHHAAGDIEYRVATREDESVLRTILARVATGGDIQLSFQREPDAFGAHFGALSQDFILARHLQDSGHAPTFVGICERVVREAFVNGERRRLPYLAGLRVLPEFRNSIRALRGGFEALRRLSGDERDLPWALTSIMNDNATARRVLGANLRGMPRYEPVGELSTFAMTAQGNAEPDRATDIDLPRIAELLLRQGAESQFATVWTHDALRAAISAGWLHAKDFLVLRREGAIRACVALWDQSASRQLVVSGYSPWLRRARPLINCAATLTGLPRLPSPGGVVRAAYLSHLAVDEAAPEDLLALIAVARAEARRRGLSLLFLGLATDHPFTAWARKLQRQREFRSQLYVVRWPKDPAPKLDSSMRLAPELALL